MTRKVLMLHISILGYPGGRGDVFHPWYARDNLYHLKLHAARDKECRSGGQDFCGYTKDGHKAEMNQCTVKHL